MIVRQATWNDILDVLDKAEGWLKHHPEYVDHTFDKMHTYSQLTAIKHISHCQILLNSDEDIVGCLLYIISPSFFSPDLEATELMYFIDPAYRSYKDAVRLIRAAEDDAFSYPIKRFTIGNSSGYRSESMEKFYKRLGYYPSSGNYCKGG